MSLKKRAIEGLLWSVLEKWGAKATKLLVFTVLARLLEPEAFGIIALAAVFIGLVNVLVDQGFADALVQRDSLEREHLDTAFWVNVVLGIVLGDLQRLSQGQ